MRKINKACTIQVCNVNILHRYFCKRHMQYYFQYFTLTVHNKDTSSKALLFPLYSCFSKRWQNSCKNAENKLNSLEYFSLFPLMLWLHKILLGNILYTLVVLVTKSCPTLGTQWTGAHQTPVSMRFPRQEYWSELAFPSPGDLLDPGIKPGLLHCRHILDWLSHQGSPIYTLRSIKRANLFLYYEVLHC